MAKRPPERYNPGELKRTRSNLGEMSGEEARRMMEVLGGEISDEKPDAHIDEKYKKLQELNRRKSDRILYSEAQGGTASVAARVSSVPIEPADGSPADGSAGYFARIRMNLTAARSEHGIMSLPGAIASIFSFFLPVREFINPRFITRGDEVFFRHIARSLSL